MIDNDLLESYFACKFKSFLKSNGQQGSKKEYEIMRSELQLLFKRASEQRLIARYGEENVSEDIDLVENQPSISKSLLFRARIKAEKYNVIIDPKFDSFPPILTRK